MDASFILAYFDINGDVHHRVLCRDNLGPIQHTPLDISSFNTDDQQYEIDDTTIMVFKISESDDNKHIPFGLFYTKALYEQDDVLDPVTAETFVNYILENKPSRKTVFYNAVLRTYIEFQNTTPFTEGDETS